MPLPSKTERQKAAASSAAQGAVVVQFPVHARRPARPAPASDEARGEILLFLGVRYERLAS